MEWERAEAALGSTLAQRPEATAAITVENLDAFGQMEDGTLFDPDTGMHIDKTTVGFDGRFRRFDPSS